MTETLDFYLFIYNNMWKNTDQVNFFPSSSWESILSNTQLFSITSREQSIHTQLNHIYRPIGTSSIGRWIKTVLNTSGEDTTKFKAHRLHSTRAAAVSKKSKMLTTDEILKHVDWWQETFQQFYNKPVIVHNKFSKAVLD